MGNPSTNFKRNSMPQRTEFLFSEVNTKAREKLNTKVSLRFCVIPSAEMQRELSKDCNRTTFCCCNSSLEGVQVYTPAWFELHWVGPRRWWRGAVDFFNQLSSNLLFWQHLCFIMSHFVFHSNEIKKRQV